MNADLRRKDVSVAEPDGLRRALDACCRTLGIAAWGCADVRGLFGGEWAAWPRAVGMVLALPEAAWNGVEQGPTADYYQAYAEANRRLASWSENLAAWIAARGYRARACPPTVSGRGLDAALDAALTAPVQHKTVATQAGLGWIGRSALLVTAGHGPRVRLASVLTDLPLRPAEPVRAGHCGTCRRCVEACPGEAIRGAAWCAGVPREALLDATACRRTAEALLRRRVGGRNAVCGICAAVCPYGRRGRAPGSEL